MKWDRINTRSVTKPIFKTDRSVKIVCFYLDLATLEK